VIVELAGSNNKEGMVVLPFPRTMVKDPPE
jgi:hypothetical protein